MSPIPRSPNSNFFEAPQVVTDSSEQRVRDTISNAPSFASSHYLPRTPYPSAVTSPSDSYSYAVDDLGDIVESLNTVSISDEGFPRRGTARDSSGTLDLATIIEPLSSAFPLGEAGLPRGTAARTREDLSSIPQSALAEELVRMSPRNIASATPQRGGTPAPRFEVIVTDSSSSAVPVLTREVTPPPAPIFCPANPTESDTPYYLFDRDIDSRRSVYNDGNSDRREKSLQQHERYYENEECRDKSGSSATDQELTPRRRLYGEFTDSRASSPKYEANSPKREQYVENMMPACTDEELIPQNMVHSFTNTAARTGDALCDADVHIKLPLPRDTRARSRNRARTKSRSPAISPMSPHPFNCVNERVSRRRRAWENDTQDMNVDVPAPTNVDVPAAAAAGEQGEPSRPTHPADSIVCPRLTTDHKFPTLHDKSRESRRQRVIYLSPVPSCESLSPMSPLPPVAEMRTHKLVNYTALLAPMESNFDARAPLGPLPRSASDTGAHTKFPYPRQYSKESEWESREPQHLYPPPMLTYSRDQLLKGDNGWNSSEQDIVEETLFNESLQLNRVSNPLCRDPCFRRSISSPIPFESFMECDEECDAFTMPRGVPQWERAASL